MANPINDSNVKFPITDMPRTLIPIRRGAVIDWKATAIAEHSRAQQSTALSSANLRHQATIARLDQQLVESYNLCAKHFAQLCAIRDHWSAFLLPRHLR